MTVKIFSAAELAAYNAAHTTPRKVLEAQTKEAKLPPRKESYKYGEFASREKRGHTAAQELEMKMLHGEDV